MLWLNPPSPPVSSPFLHSPFIPLTDHFSRRKIADQPHDSFKPNKRAATATAHGLATQQSNPAFESSQCSFYWHHQSSDAKDTPDAISARMNAILAPLSLASHGLQIGKSLTRRAPAVHAELQALGARRRELFFFVVSGKTNPVDRDTASRGCGVRFGRESGNDTAFVIC